MQNIKLEDILKIIEQFEASSIDSLRYKTGEEEIELSRNKNGSVTSSLENMDSEKMKELLKKVEGNVPTTGSAQSEEPVQAKEEEEKEEEKEDTENLFTVTSPIIGTFYKSPAPGKGAYVKKGDKVNQGDTLCIVEAMKVMNKIESEVSGEVKEIVAEDGQTVEYGSELFKIKLD
jgi:acetyl-CoA carboxylase biotin carboxyl carrier protein